MSTKKKLLLGSAGAAAAGGGGFLDITDVFSTFLYEGTGSAQNIENGIALGNSNDGGSVEFDGTGDYLNLSTPVVPATGQFSLEAFIYPTATTDEMIASQFSTGTTGRFMFRLDNGKLNFNWAASELTDANSITANAWSHCLVTRDASNVIRLFVNGALRKSTTNSVSFDQTNFTIGASRPASPEKFFNGFISNVRVVSGAIPTEYQTSSTTEGAAIYTTPTSGLTAVSNTALLTCQGSTPLVDNSSNSYAVTSNADATARAFGPFTGSSGEGGLVWTKSRSAARNHSLHDSARGVTCLLKSNGNNAQYCDAIQMASFNSNGFTVGSDGSSNTNGDNYVSWTFRKAPKFFDVGTISFNSSGVGSYSHNLGVTPAMVIFKLTNTTGDWFVWHKDLTSQNYAMFLNSTAASSNQGSWATYTDTTVSFNSSLFANDTAVVYLFAHHANDGSATGFGPDGDSPVISCGSYTGNGSTTGVFQDLGFEPQWIIFKETTITEPWVMLDNMRGVSGLGGNDPRLQANSSVAEAGGEIMQFNATGFTPLTADDKVNGSSRSYIYMAIRRGPLAEPTSATDVFAIDTYGGTAPTPPLFNSGFPVDMAFYKHKGNTTNFVLTSRFQQGKYLITDTASAEASSANLKFDFQNGYFDATGVNSDYLSWMWKRAPSYFDCVCYSGTQVARTISHNLGLNGTVPEMIWVKNRDGTTPWMVYHSALGNQAYLQLNSTAAAVTGNTSRWNATTPTASVFSLGDSGSVNGSGSNYIAYLFATLAGVSKVGSYTGTGSTLNIDCGFSSSARFVLIKRTNDTNEWTLFDTARGIVAGNDPYLYLSNNAAQVNAADFIDPYSAGFSLTGVSSLTNENGSSYIFYAIA